MVCQVFQIINLRAIILLLLLIGGKAFSQENESTKLNASYSDELESAQLFYQNSFSSNHGSNLSVIQKKKRQSGYILPLKNQFKQLKNKVKVSRSSDDFGYFIVWLSVLVCAVGFILIILTTILSWWWFLIGLGVIVLGLLIMAGGSNIVGGSKGSLFGSLVGLLTLLFGGLALVIWGLVELIIWIVD